jgi:hypothetical protein
MLTPDPVIGSYKSHPLLRPAACSHANRPTMYFYSKHYVESHISKTALLKSHANARLEVLLVIGYVVQFDVSNFLVV